MKIIDDINDLVSDQDLTYMILIITILFGLIPVITAIRVEKKSKIKGKTANKKTFTKSGKWYIFLAIIICLLGYWKLQRDNISQLKIQRSASELKDTINVTSTKVSALTDTVDNLHKILKIVLTKSIEQYKSDSAINNQNIKRYVDIFNKINSSLNSNNIGLDKNFNIVKGSRLQITGNEFKGFAKENIHIEYNYGASKKN